MKCGGKTNLGYLQILLRCSVVQTFTHQLVKLFMKIHILSISPKHNYLAFNDLHRSEGFKFLIICLTFYQFLQILTILSLRSQLSVTLERKPCRSPLVLFLVPLSCPGLNR